MPRTVKTLDMNIFTISNESNYWTNTNFNILKHFNKLSDLIDSVIFLKLSN